MKKINFLTFILGCLCSIATVSAQTVSLTFTGKDSVNRYVQLNKVVVTNLTKSWQETIYWPDTVLTLTNKTGISDVQEQELGLFSYPNPFNGTSSVLLTIPQSQEVYMAVYNITGQRVMEFSSQLEAGTNHFDIGFQKPQVYFLVVNTIEGRMVQKLVNVGHSGDNYIKFRSTLPLSEEQTSKIQKRQSSQPFSYGDMMEYVGYAIINGKKEESQRITQAQGNSQTFSLKFDVTVSTMKNAQFSVSDTQKVYFSPGNLQWSATNGGSTPTSHAVAYNDTAAGTWRFAPNQWDTIGVGNNNISSTYIGWIDLFYWGTSGYNNAYPYMNTNAAITCGNENNDISETYFDWGVYNAIYNPKTNITDAPGTWRTLTKDEWNFLLFTRTTLSGIRFAKSVVNGVLGLIVLPDNWITTIYNLSNVNSFLGQSNYIDSVSWGELVNVGCVFLPAAGCSYYTSYYGGELSYNSSTYGSYGWWSVFRNVDGYGYGLFEWYNNQEYYGSSVRLVQDVNKPIPPKIKPVTLNTQSVIFISDTSVMGKSTITNSGGANVTARGVCWSTSPNPTINDNHTSDSSGIGSFTSHITGLTARTTYYVRADATNAVGTAYGNQIVFTVAPSKSFSVSDSTFVYFSPGNLQWSATNGGNIATTHAVAGNGTASGTWRFAPNQWDKIGSTNSSISSSYTGWIDLFGWGTSGYNNKYPYMTATIDSLYGNGNNHIAGTNYDWGVYNAIYNPTTNTTNVPGTWRTLTKDEWAYLLNTRSTASSVRYAKATVMGVEGLIIVPDNWSITTYPLQSTNTSDAYCVENTINNSDWAKLEAAGCIFLPVAGYRSYGTSVYDVGSSGYYWSTTYGDSFRAYNVVFSSGFSDFSYHGRRNVGLSVRLVRDVQ